MRIASLLLRSIEAFFEANKKHTGLKGGYVHKGGKIGQFLSLGSDKLSFFFSPISFVAFSSKVSFHLYSKSFSKQKIRFKAIIKLTNREN